MGLGSAPTQRDRSTSQSRARLPVGMTPSNQPLDMASINNRVSGGHCPSCEAQARWSKAFAASRWPWRQGPRGSPSVRDNSSNTTPNASIRGHPASPCCDGTSTPHRAQMRIASNISASFPNRGCLASPGPAVPLACQGACLGHDPGRPLTQVGDRLQDVPATLTLELMDPAHPVVDGVLDQRVRATDGALGFGCDHARSIDGSRSSAHRPFG